MAEDVGPAGRLVLRRAAVIDSLVPLAGFRPGAVPTVAEQRIGRGHRVL